MRTLRKPLLLFLAISGSTLLAGLLTVTALYHQQFDAELAHLEKVAISQALLVEAVAHFDQRFSRDYPDGPREATLSQINDAFRRRNWPGAHGEFVLGWREGDRILFLRDHYDLAGPAPQAHPLPPASLPFDSALAEPMRRALGGQAGTVVGLDYNEETVLAAYQPLETLGMGLVCKIHLAELRQPFVTIGALVLISALVIVAVGLLLHRRLDQRVKCGLRLNEARFRSLAASANAGVIAVDARGRVTDWNAGAEKLFGYAAQEIIGQPARLLFPECAAQPFCSNAPPGPGMAPPRQAVELEAMRRDGSLFPVLLSPSEWTDDGQCLSAAIIQDISVQKNAREEYLQLKDHLEQEERGRLATVLHDGVAQSMQAIRLGVKMLAAKPEPERVDVIQSLDRISDEIGAVIEELRDVTADLRPRFLERMALDEALIWWTERIGRRSGIRIDVHSDGQLGPLDPEVKHHCFRSIQEALTNTVKHAEADRVAIRLSRPGNGRVRLVFTDNGEGFNTEEIQASPNGLGLCLIEERIRGLGGAIDIETSPGRGMRITIEAPA